MTVRTSIPRLRPTALIPLILLFSLGICLAPLEQAAAGTISGIWVWPQRATTNSCRWVRIQLNHASTENVYELYLSGIYGIAPNLPAPPQPVSTIVQAGTGSIWPRMNSVVTRHGSDSSINHVFTIGPFCGSYNAFWERPADYPYVIGYLGSPGGNQTQPTNSTNYQVTCSTRFYAISSGTPDTSPQGASTTYQTVHDNDDLLEWYVPDGGGGTIDPLSVGPVEILPDSGSGSSAYTFRVKFRSGLYSGLNLQPRWRTEDDFPDAVGWNPGFWDRGRGSQSSRGDPNNVGQFNWLYGSTTDTWLDQTGYNRGEFNDRGVFEPRVLLVIDGQHWAPHYMVPENPSDTNYEDGAIFTYTVRPTDYHNFIDNIFLLPYDFPGSDSWDTFAMRLAGRPTSNNYVSLTAGPHTYEFWATDDFAPVGNRAWVQVAWPGNDHHVEYIERVAPEPRRVDGLRSAVSRSRLSVWREHSPNAGADSGIPYDPSALINGTDYMRRFGDVSVDAPDSYGYSYKSHEASTDADYMNLNNLANPTFSLRKMPNVNPVLTAHPFFGRSGQEGGISAALPANPWNPGSWSGLWSGHPSIAGGYMENDFPNNTFFTGGTIGANTNPFQVETGWGPDAPGPWKYTNDDTIVPNYANIWKETAANPFRGGKWTQATTYTLRINYWHSSNVPPSFMRIYIRKNDPAGTPGTWFPYTMEKFDPTDLNCADGMVYQFEVSPDQLPTEMSPSGGGTGDYNYYFVANDGTRQATFPDRPDYHAFTDNNGTARSIVDPGDIGVGQDETGQDYYWFRANRKPALSNESVSPAAGSAGDQFTFRVDYADPDGEALNPTATGDRPFAARLYVDLYGDLYGAMTITAVISNTQMQLTTGTAHVFTNNELTGLYVVMRDGAAVRKVYRVVGNIGNTVNLANSGDSPGQLVADGVAGGDTLYFAQRTVMDKQDPMDNDFTDGATYVFNTGTTMVLGPGTHSYYFEFADDWGGWIYPGRADVRVEGEYVRYPNAGEFTGPEVVENTAPELLDFRFRPDTVGVGPDGTTSTAFIFYVSYMDQQNNPPTFILLGIDGTKDTPLTTLDLYPEDPADTVYTDGAVYRSDEIRLTEGMHVFRARASDGMQNYPPPEAYTPGPFCYKGPTAMASGVTETSLDYSISGTGFPDGRLAGISIRMLDGAAAGNDYTIDSNAGDQLTFVATTLVTDGVAVNDHFILDAAPGPEVAPNTPPELLFSPLDPDPDYDAANKAFPGVDPNVGDSSTTFTYRIVYKDSDQYGGVRGNPPAWVRVYIDSVEHDMTPVDPGDHDYTDGAEFQFTMGGLVQGAPHTHFFLASDGRDTARRPNPTQDVPLPPANRYDGPIVDEAPRPPGTLFVTDVPADNGEALDFTFDASLDDGGGPDDVTEYHLYRNESGQPFSGLPVLVILASDQPSYAGQDTAAVTGLQKGVNYYYVVRAYDGTPITVDSNGVPDPAAVVDPARESVDSNVEGPIAPEDDIPPGAPSGLVAADPGLGGTIDLTWTLSPDDGAGWGDVVEYRLYRNTTGVAFAPADQIDTIPAGQSSHQDQTATDGIDYYYGLSAYDGVNESAIVDATPSPIQSTDNQAPQIIPTQPLDLAMDVPRDTDIEFDVQDTGAGVDPSTLLLRVNGVDIPLADLTITGAGAQISVLYDPPADFDFLTSVNVHVEVQDLGGALGTLDYKFTIVGPPVYEITGVVLDRAGAPVPNVTVSAGALSDMTDVNGNYTITGLAAGTYTVIPALTNTAFVPESALRTVPPSPQRADFIAEPGYDISGRVVDAVGAGMIGVRVTDGIHEAITNANGDFDILDLRAGAYTIVPQLAGSQFTPPTLDVTVPGTPDPPGNVTGVLFTGSVETFSISGNIRTADGTRLAGVAVVARDVGGTEYTAISAANGAYFIGGVPAGFYTVEPTKADWVFDPATKDVDIAGDRSGIDFIAVPVYAVTLNTGLQMSAFPLTALNLNPTAYLPANVEVARWDPTLPDTVTDKYIRGNPGAPLPAQYLLVPGFSFWYNNRTGGPVNLSIPGTPTDTTIPFSMGVERGWNQAGDMFNGPLPWSYLSIAAGQAVRDYGFLYNPATGGYDLVTDLTGLGATAIVPKNAGFWIKSDAKRTVMVTPVTTSEVSDEKPSVELAAGDFLVPIVARADSSADTTSVAGVVKDAGDNYKIENPPAVSPYVDLYFPGDDGQRLACDVRSTGADTEAWDFVVATDLTGSKVELSLPDLSRVPNDKTVTLVDQATGKRIYARTMTSYSYTADETGLRRFTLEIAPKTQTGLVVTAATARQTGAGVAVTYSLSAPATVTATVMNIAGRPMRTLATGGMAAKGANSLAWNLRANSGTRVPAGRYLVRITAVAENGQSAQAVTAVQVRR